MKKIALITTILLLSFLSFISPSLAIPVTECFATNSSGFYQLTQNIFADGSFISSSACIDIANDNVVLDLNNYGIYNTNQTVGVGIRVRVNQNNVTIQNGLVSDFQSPSLDLGCIAIGGLGGYWDRNIKIKNVIAQNCSIGLWVTYVSGSSFQVGIDNPQSQYALIGDYIDNSSLVITAKSQNWAGILRNISNSHVSGRFDTNVIIQKNQSTIIGSLFGWTGLFPSTVTTETISTQTQGMGLVLWNSTNTVYQDIMAYGLVQAIYCGQFSANNIFARVVVPSGVSNADYMGKIYLTEDCINNQLCEVSNNILTNAPAVLDDCGVTWGGLWNYVTPIPWNSSSQCISKNNTVYSSCWSLDQLSFITNEGVVSLSAYFTTPLIPSISGYLPQYPFLAFLTTPFFLSVAGILIASVFIAIKTKKPMFGIFALISMTVFFSFIIGLWWFGVIIGVISGYIIWQKDLAGSEHE